MKAAGEITTIRAGKEFRICPSCGYELGFHTSFVGTNADKNNPVKSTRGRPQRPFPLHSAHRIMIPGHTPARTHRTPGLFFISGRGMRWQGERRSRGNRD
ncbi:MAG TPA: hypothetical protein VHN82_06340, partial [Methanoregula sp.]|nr:hypothetical protein [Methanoregula sp.]